MGVSGCGKSTVGRLLAERLGADFVDADDLHPLENTQKMTAGTPLTDEDRAPWLRAVGAVIHDQNEAGHSVVVACSALRIAYRDLLREKAPNVVFAHLAGSPEVLEERLLARRGHFMPASLLASQLSTLEPLASGERGITIDVALSANDAVSQALEFLARRG